MDPVPALPHPEAGKQICGFQNIGFRVQGLGYPLVLKPSSKKKSILFALHRLASSPAMVLGLGWRQGSRSRVTKRLRLAAFENDDDGDDGGGAADSWRCW